MESDSVKELKVTLTDADAAVLKGGKKPRRRATRKQSGGAATAEKGADATPETGRVQDLGGSLSPSEAAMAEGPVARIEKLDAPAVPTGIETHVSGEGAGAPILKGGARPITDAISPLAVQLSVTPPAIVMPSLSKPATGGGGAGIVIGGKRIPGGLKVDAPSQAPKILPTKRRLTSAPAAQTLRKPKFCVGGGGGGEIAEVANPGAPKHESGATLGMQAAPLVGGAFKQTRRFKARKIKLTVKSSRIAKEDRHKIKARVRAMPLVEVKKFLLGKGIIKVSAAEKLPEEMMRNMLRDYLLLHNAD